MMNSHRDDAMMSSELCNLLVGDKQLKPVKTSTLICSHSRYLVRSTLCETQHQNRIRKKHSYRNGSLSGTLH